MPDALTENVLEASFEGVPFPVADVTVNGSRSHVAHMAYRRTGADLEGTGLDAYTGPLTVPFVNADSLVARYGTIYPDLRNRFISKCEVTNIGRLVHPLRGPLDAMITSWSEHADPKNRGGTIVTVNWIEHNGSSLILFAEDNSVPQDYESVASTQADAADAAMGAVDPANAGGWTATSPVVATQLTALATATTFGDIDASIRTMLSVIATNLALAVFSLPSAHTATVSLYTLQGTLYRLRTRALGRLLQARTIVTPRAMAAWEIAQQQYGDASLDALIMQANNFEDALAIPAGASVLIPPAP